jgi:hypothetical protein
VKIWSKWDADAPLPGRSAEIGLPFHKLLCEDLVVYLATKPSLLAGCDMYLLRNQSRKGIDFFEAGNFYPDFILWLLRNEK